MARAAVFAAVALCLVAAAAAGPLTVVETARAPAAWVRGDRVHPDHPMELIIAVKQTNTQELEDALLEVSDPDSPRWGQHMTREEVDSFVAPQPEHIMAVLAWLKNNGVDMTRLEATGNSDLITVHTTAAIAERLMNGQYFYWTHRERTKFTVVRLGMGEYLVPSEVAAAIDFAGPTVRFPTIRALAVRRPEVGELGVTPTFLRSLYNVGDATGSAAGNNQSVAQFLGQYYAPSDLASFFTQFAPTEKGKTPTVMGGNQASSPGMEASLDIEYIMSVATNVPTTFWSTAGQQPDNPGNEPFLKWLGHVATTSGNGMPKTVSVSYGDDEGTVNFGYATRVNTEFKKAGMRGISLMFASGDGGVGGSQPSLCSKFVPTFPAGSPWVTAVGGTQSSNPEVTASLSGGGFSNYWARPSYQVDAVKHYFSVAQNLPSSSVYNHTGAGFPDVAAQAENFNIVVSGFTTFVAGTSCASPTFSAVLSLVNDARLAAGKKSLGYLNPVFYKNPSMFNDITSGNNPGCNTNGFQAAVGWDPTTGLGTANFQKMKAVLLALP